jgi:hypothetical protein
MNATNVLVDRHKSGYTFLGVFLIVALALSASFLRFVPDPFVWIGWGWTLALFGSAWYLRTGIIRVVMFNAAFLILALVSAETYLAIHEHGRPTYSNPYYADDDVLGVAPNKSSRTQARKVERGKVEYDVTYTVTAKGLRVSPPPKDPGSAIGLLFFGCSFTYGEGLRDEESMPFQVGVQSDGRYHIYNFGFHGYGPNQMLAEIESGRVLELVDGVPQYAIYQALPDHVARVAGKIPYGRHSPRYRLGPDGSARLNGHFDDGQKVPSAFVERIKKNLEKSAIYRRIELLEPGTDQEDVRLYLAVVKRSRDLLVTQYPGIKFKVILWRNFPYEQKLYDELETGFARMNIAVYKIDDMLPNYRKTPEEYWLSKDDAHPNAIANRQIANYLVSKVLPADASAYSTK